MPLGHRSKVDDNHRAIARGLVKNHLFVQSLHSVGGGCPDLLVAGCVTFRMVLLEVKMPGKKPNDAQVKWAANWPLGLVYTVTTLEEALAACRDAGVD